MAGSKEGQGIEQDMKETCGKKFIHRVLFRIFGNMSSYYLLKVYIDF